MRIRADEPEKDDGGFIRRAALARLADAAHTGLADVELGFHEPAEPDAPRRPFARFRPAAAIRFSSRDGAARDVQTETAVALGLPRWQPGCTPQRAAQWLLRRSPQGLELMAPRRLLFVRSRRSLPEPWRAAAVTQGFVLVAYGYDHLAAALTPYLDAL